MSSYKISVKTGDKKRSWDRCKCLHHIARNKEQTPIPTISSRTTSRLETLTITRSPQQSAYQKCRESNYGEIVGVCSAIGI
jgi:hypothetical protein